MRIGIDIDNVISNFDDALFNEFLKHDKTLRGTGVINKDADYVTRGMFDWSQAELDIFYENNIERIVSNLDLKEDAKEYIDKLKQDGHYICIITGRDNGEYSDPYKMTKDWLDKFNIKYDKLVLTNAYQNEINGKGEKCLENNIDIMIDDSKTVYADCLSKGVPVVLMDTPYNRKIEATRVHGWQEFYEFINKKNVILDTDTYNECDDQFALAYLLKSQNLFNVEAITIAPYSHKDPLVNVKEGLENSYNEVLKICNWLDFNSKDKVYKGSENYISNGYDGSNEAVDKIIEVSLKNTKTYILAIGALTNVALAIKKEPKIIDKIEVIWLGGHSLLQPNNLEYNFKQDIDAVRIVFDSKVKLTVIPCKNVASNLRISIYELEHYLKDKSELCNYLIERFKNDGYHGIKEARVIWDISVVAYLINNSWFKTKTINAPIVNDDTSYTIVENNHFITMVYDMDANSIYKDLFNKLGDISDN